MKLNIGTRGSELALIQVDIVTNLLLKLDSRIEIEMPPIRTHGDQNQEVPIESLDYVGLFSSSINELVASGEVDFAVHSAKDLPSKLEDPLKIISIPERASPYDVLVSKKNIVLSDLPPESIIGTSSPRRRAQVLHLRPDLKIKPVRGNVDTRLKKLKKGDFDALILAEAGLRRMGREEEITERLPITDFTPPAGQGALVLVSRDDNMMVNPVLEKIKSKKTWADVLAERAFIERIGGGCKTPLGVTSKNNGNKQEIYGCILSPDGKTSFRIHSYGDASNPKELGKTIASELLEQGAEKLVKMW